MKRRTRNLGACVAGTFGLVLASCTAGEAEPSKGVYTVQFPSTAAAVATDFVQILVFDVKSPADRANLCEDLIAAHIADPSSLTPSVNPPSPAANICEMHAGKKPVTVPYGEHAVLAIAQRKDRQDQLRDLMIGCAIMTVGEGDAPLPIPVRLVSVSQPIPPTNCASVGEYCDGKCT
jgi:hypothetical protein